MPIKIKRSDRKKMEQQGLLPPARTSQSTKAASGPARTYQDKNLFLEVCKAHNLPVPVAEYKFHETRKWRFDWLFDGVVALEIQGALFSGGRHTRGAALLSEYQKLNEAQLAGFVVLLVTPEQVETGEAFALVRRALLGDDNVSEDQHKQEKNVHQGDHNEAQSLADPDCGVREETGVAQDKMPTSVDEGR